MITEKHKKYDYMSKIVIVGDSAVGKTNILLRLTEDHFRLIHNSTIGVDFKIKTLQVDNKKIKFTIWDTAGQDRFRTITSNYYRGSDGVIFTYSISDKDSFNNMQSWVNNVEQNTGKHVCKMILGNKCDLSDRERQVSTQQGQKLANRLGIPFFQVSAKQNIQLTQSFLFFAKLVKQKIQKQQIDPSTIRSIHSLKPKKSLSKSCC